VSGWRRTAGRRAPPDGAQQPQRIMYLDGYRQEMGNSTAGQRLPLHISASTRARVRLSIQLASQVVK
jgi:hypothetical protein